MSNTFKVWLVEDDTAVRQSVTQALRYSGYEVHPFADGTQILDEPTLDAPGCFVIDVQLPAESGVDLWKSLRARGHISPCIFISGYGSIETAVGVVRDGAVSFLQKPFRQAKLLASLRDAESRFQREHSRRSLLIAIEAKLQTLSPREHEVAVLVARGRLTKQIAKQLGVSVKTVETHRSRITQKLEVRSVAQLVRMLTSYELLREWTPGWQRRDPSVSLN